MNRTCKTLGGLSFQDWLYLGIAVKELLLARIRHATQSIGKILIHLQEARPPTFEPASNSVDLARLSWALSAAAARVPWRSDCLLKVMAADRWLRRNNLSSEFYLGVGKNTTGQFIAHVWLSSNGIAVAAESGKGLSKLISPAGR